MPPIAGLVESHFECLRLNRINAGDQGIELRGWRAAQKIQREMQGVGAHAATAPVLMQPFSGVVECGPGGLVGPQGENSLSVSASTTLDAFMAGQSRSIRHTASAAMPSPRPVKPSFSVVVALTLTRSMATPRSSAMCAVMRTMCGAILGV